MPLPLLIQNILDFYRWREGIQSLNKEYRKHVSEEGYGDGLYWKRKISGNWVMIYDTQRRYRDKVDSFTNPMSWARIITTKFVDIPKRYIYSSGMRHPGGYKQIYPPKIQYLNN